MRTKINFFAIVLALVGLAGSTATLRAQPPVTPPAQPPVPTPSPALQFQQNQLNSQQTETRLNNLTTTNAPELYPGENEDVGPQSLLKVKPAHNYFQGLADVQYAYTDNNRLDNHVKIATAYTISTVQLSFSPEQKEIGSGKFASHIGFRSQWYNYSLDGTGDHESALDFDAQEFFASAQYLWHDHWEFDGEVDYTRLLTQRNYDEFYSETLPTLTVQRLFHLNDKTLLSISLQEAYHFSQVPLSSGPFRDANDRLDSILGFTLTWQPVQNLIVQPYYRLNHTYYPRTDLDINRNDVLHTVGLALTYYFTPQFSGRIYGNGAFYSSDDQNTPSYTQFNTGIGASFAIQF